MTPDSEAEVRPPPRADLSPNPDPDTATSPDLPDFTGDEAGSRVLHLTTRWLRYGTNDKGHAAALILSVLLLIIVGLVVVAGVAAGYLLGDQPGWLEKTLTWLGNGFFFVAGVAIGKSVEGR